MTADERKDLMALRDRATTTAFAASRLYDWMHYILSSNNEILAYGKVEKTSYDDFKYLAAAANAAPKLVRDVDILEAENAELRQRLEGFQRAIMDWAQGRLPQSTSEGPA